MENHYKDNYWAYPEFAQASDVFCEILDRVPSPRLGVNYDPSNALLAGEDPLALLAKVKDRVVTMHASDRSLKPGTRWTTCGRRRTPWATPRSCSTAKSAAASTTSTPSSARCATRGFNGWISIEDGVNGMDELRRSAEFLRRKMAVYWPAR